MQFKNHITPTRIAALAAGVSVVALSYAAPEILAAFPMGALLIGAVVNTKSTEVTNADAGDDKPNEAYKMRGRAATLETAAADDAGSVYRLFRVHSSSRPASLKIGHDALTNMTTADIGVYECDTDGGSVVDVDLFGSAVDMSSASSGMVERLLEAANANIDKMGKALWEWLGLTADPGVYYDICVTATTNDPTAAGTIAGVYEEFGQV